MPKSSETIEELVKAFREGVIGHRENLCSDPKLAKRHSDRYSKAVKKLASQGEAGLSALSELLNDPSEIVRASAGHYLIHRFPDKVIPVLQALVSERGRGFTAALALVTLEKWKRGMCFDPRTGKEEVREKPLT